MSRATGVGVALAVLLLGGLWLVFNQQPNLRTEEAVPPIDPDTVYDPIVAGEDLPDGFRWILSRDRIRPVYVPAFVPATDAGWADDDLVIGLEIDGAAKAYPVGFLNRREMVNDSVAGIPVLVTW